jgi:hypothetical protein
MPPAHDPWTTAAGAANGNWALSECLADGAAAGSKAAADAGFKARKVAVPKARDDAGHAVAALWWVKQSTGKAFVDYQNDVSAGDMPLAAREGYDHIELAKRYTTTGMATDQGKLGNVNAIGILRRQRASFARHRHHHVPAVLYAGVVRRAGRAARRPALPAGTPVAAAWLGRKAGRGLCRDRTVASLKLVSA